ncbi:MAG: DUF3644 domain-containing protein [Chloroflexota bacterium]|nr:DUF3644 domain-containing protein [Chloroflexota bacterium]
MPRRDSIGDSYRFFSERERTSEPFSLDELCEATGWSVGTPRTYLTKKWSLWIRQRPDGRYEVSGLTSISEDQYRRHMSQKQEVSQEPSRPELPENVERLVIKAQQSAMLALDVYNRPATQFRTEGYIVLMVVAWTAALHAIFERDNTDYIYRDSNGDPTLIDGEHKAWSLVDSMNHYFGNGSPPVRRNLEFIIGLRNKIEHRYVPSIDAHVAGECQALLLNFDRLVSDAFGEYYSIADSLSVPLQTSTLRNTARTSAMRQLQADHYDEVMEYIDAYRTGLPDSVYSDPSYSFRVYLIPKVGNHESSSDLAFEFVPYDPTDDADMDALQRQVALIRERQVPVANPGMHKPSQVAKLVAERIGRPFSTNHHTRAWKAYRVRVSGIQPDQCVTEYCQFDTVHQDYFYTDAWVEFLVQKLSEDAEYTRIVTFRG